MDEIAEVGDNEAMLPEDGPASFMSVVGPATPLMLKTAFLESRYKEQVRVCMDVMKEEVSGPAFEEVHFGSAFISELTKLFDGDKGISPAQHSHP